MRLKQAHALERERVRIARDLHDDLGARLTQMAFATDIAAMNLTDPVATHSQLRDVSEQARQATRALDETVWMVDPRKDSLPQLVGYCSQYATNFFHRTPIGCRQQICSQPPDYPLGGELRHHLFAAYKEALNNVLKHSGASEVMVRISVRGRKLLILIRDNGRGFTPEQADGSRNGLKNMNSRLEAIGGSCVLRSKPGRGTRVLLRVNCQILSPDSRT
jgi:signal transduction histidine kinase